MLSYGFNAGESKAQLSDCQQRGRILYVHGAFGTASGVHPQYRPAGRRMIGAVFAMAGLINFTNMMITNIITRRHEFATMQSIGMTRRQLRHMMIWEGLYYGLGAGVLGCVAAGLGLTVLDRRGSHNRAPHFRYGDHRGAAADYGIIVDLS